MNKQVELYRRDTFHGHNRFWHLKTVVIVNIIDEDLFSNTVLYYFNMYCDLRTFVLLGFNVAAYVY